MAATARDNLLSAFIGLPLAAHSRSRPQPGRGGSNAGPLTAAHYPAPLPSPSKYDVVPIRRGDRVKFTRILEAPAFRFVLTMGVVNLFADVTYEGGGGINGAFLGSLGASAAAIAIIAGAGEFLGYGMRSVAGYVADRTGRHWPLTFVGYVINLLAVPAMALASGWPAAAMLVFAERTGRAL